MAITERRRANGAVSFLSTLAHSHPDEYGFEDDGSAAVEDDGSAVLGAQSRPPRR